MFKKIIIFFLLSLLFLTERLFAQSEDQRVIRNSLEELLNMKISTASKYEQSAFEAPASVSIITSEEIARYGYQTLDEALRSIGTFFQRYDRNYVYMGLRGFNPLADYNNHILLLINGHIINENFYGAAYLGTDLGISLDIVDHIEVVMGPGSVLYGTSAMFAVINVITKKGERIEGVKISGEIGSYGRKEGSLILGKKSLPNFSFSLGAKWGDVEGQDLYFKEYNTPATNNGLAEEADWDRYHGIFGYFNYKNLIMQTFFSWREKGIPTGAWEMEFNNNSAKSLDERKYVELKYERKINFNKSLMFRGYLDQFVYRGTYPYNSLTDSVQYDANNGDWVGGETQVLWDLKDNHRLILGMEYKNSYRADYRFWEDDTTYFDDNFPFYILSGYLQDSYQISNNFSFTLGLRHDRYSITGSSTSPRLAILINPVKQGTIKALYNEAFRAPNVYELYYEDFSTTKSNPKLKPEKIRTYEINWEQKVTDYMFVKTSVYHYDVRNLIDQIMDPIDSLTQFQNLNKVKANGFEVELDTRNQNALWSYSSYSYQYAWDLNSGEHLINSPIHIAKLGISYPIIRNVFLSTELYYESARKTIYGTKTNPFLLTNIHIWARPQTENKNVNKFISHIELSLSCKNLFDVKYELPGGYEHLQTAIPQDGRNYVLKITLSI
jgi:iron complex outermembrane receptor protein